MARRPLKPRSSCTAQPPRTASNHHNRHIDHHNDDRDLDEDKEREKYDSDPNYCPAQNPPTAFKGTMMIALMVPFEPFFFQHRPPNQNGNHTTEVLNLFVEKVFSNTVNFAIANFWFYSLTPWLMLVMVTMMT